MRAVHLWCQESQERRFDPRQRADQQRCSPPSTTKRHCARMRNVSRGAKYYTDHNPEKDNDAYAATLTRLKGLKLDGMARLEEQLAQPASHGLTFEERFGLLVDRETSWRDTRRLERLLKQARLKYPGACLEDLDTHATRELDRRLVMSLASCDWVRAGQSVIATGATGLGKSWIACWRSATSLPPGFSVLYTRFSRLSRGVAHRTRRRQLRPTLSAASAHRRDHPGRLGARPHRPGRARRSA